MREESEDKKKFTRTYSFYTNNKRDLRIDSTEELDDVIEKLDALFADTFVEMTYMLKEDELTKEDREKAHRKYEEHYEDLSDAVEELKELELNEEKSSIADELHSKFRKVNKIEPEIN